MMIYVYIYIYTLYVTKNENYMYLYIYIYVYVCMHALNYYIIYRVEVIMVLVYPNADKFKLIIPKPRLQPVCTSSNASAWIDAGAPECMFFPGLQRRI